MNKHKTNQDELITKQKPIEIYRDVNKTSINSLRRKYDISGSLKAETFKTSCGDYRLKDERFDENSRNV